MGPGGASGPPGQGEREPRGPTAPFWGPGSEFNPGGGAVPRRGGPAWPRNPRRPGGGAAPGDDPSEAPPAPRGPGGNKWASEEPPRGPRAQGRREPDLRSP